jgi:hypothetical protein
MSVNQPEWIVASENYDVLITISTAVVGQHCYCTGGESRKNALERKA